MANKPPKKWRKRKKTHDEKEGEKREKTTTHSEKKEEVSNISKQWDKGWIHVICVHKYNPLSSDNNTAGQQKLTNYPTQRKNEQSH